MKDGTMSWRNESEEENWFFNKLQFNEIKKLAFHEQIAAFYYIINLHTCPMQALINIRLPHLNCDNSTFTKKTWHSESPLQKPDFSSKCHFHRILYSKWETSRKNKAFNEIKLSTHEKLNFI